MRGISQSHAIKGASYRHSGGQAVPDRERCHVPICWDVGEGSEAEKQNTADVRSIIPRMPSPPGRDPFVCRHSHLPERPTFDADGSPQGRGRDQDATLLHVAFSEMDARPAVVWSCPFSEEIHTHWTSGLFVKASPPADSDVSIWVRSQHCRGIPVLF